MKLAMRFAVAKYVPDLYRMEPRNLGVVLWSEGGHVASRFLGEAGGAFRTPSLVEKDSRYAYRQWIAYWRHQLATDGIADRRGEFIPRTSSRYFDALLAKSKEQFRLVESGHFSEHVAEREIPEVLSELYSRLVERPSGEPSKTEMVELKKRSDELIEMAEVPTLHDLPVPRYVWGALRTFTVDYAWGPVGKPEAVFHRVLLSRPQSVNGNAFMFHALTNDTNRPLAKDRCGALVNGSQQLDEEGRSGLQILGHVATIIDVSRLTAAKQIMEFAARIQGN